MLELNDETKQFITSEIHRVFKVEMKENIVPLIISAMHEHNVSKNHDIMEKIDLKLDNMKTSFKNRFHRISKILMEE